MGVNIYTSKEVTQIMESGAIAYETHMRIREHIKPGVSTAELDEVAREFIYSKKAKPAFLGLYGFPASICTCVNDRVVHGIPDKKQILDFNFGNMKTIRFFKILMKCLIHEWTICMKIPKGQVL